MVYTKSILHNYEPFITSKLVKIGDGSNVYAYGSGSLTIDTGHVTCELANVWYVPNIRFNILSVTKLTDQGLMVNFSGPYCTVLRDKDCEPILAAHQQDKLYTLCTRINNRGHLVPVVNVATADSHNTSEGQLWHSRLGHIAKTSLEHILDNKCLV